MGKLKIAVGGSPQVVGDFRATKVEDLGKGLFRVTIKGEVSEPKWEALSQLLESSIPSEDWLDRYIKQLDALREQEGRQKVSVTQCT